jgi:hypothetical protein
MTVTRIHILPCHEGGWAISSSFFARCEGRALVAPLPPGGIPVGVHVESHSSRKTSEITGFPIRSASADSHCYARESIWAVHPALRTAIQQTRTNALEWLAREMEAASTSAIRYRADKMSHRGDG